MTLQSARPLVEHPEAAERLGRAIDDLDSTIRIIRSAVFGLRDHGPTGQTPKLRSRVVRAVDAAVPALGFTPALRMEGLIDTEVPRTVADQVVAVVGEALSNIVRHAQAGKAEVAVVAEDGVLTVTASDDGVGIPSAGRRPSAGDAQPPDHRRGGFRNLTERAPSGWAAPCRSVRSRLRGAAPYWSGGCRSLRQPTERRPSALRACAWRCVNVPTARAAGARAPPS